MEIYISQSDKEILRKKAERQAKYAELPVMREREQRWREHNDSGSRTQWPLIHFDTWSCENELLPPLECSGELAREAELNIERAVLNHEQIDDDRPVAGCYSCKLVTDFVPFNLTTNLEHAANSIGVHFVSQIEDLAEDLPKLQKSTYFADAELTRAKADCIKAAIGDILPVVPALESPFICLTQQVVHLMGMENMLYSLIDCPDEFKEMMSRLADDYIEYYGFLEKNGLLVLNNDNVIVPQASFGFTSELPRPESPARQGGAPELKDMWLFMDSQETVGVSPDMYAEFFFPYYSRCAEAFGLVSYGCCEGVDPIWDNCISRMGNLRKVSISPWCNEEFMGERLRGTDIIYHRKPSPNPIGVGTALDEKKIIQSTDRTLHCAKGCKLEFAIRDVYVFNGDLSKPRRTVELMRREIDKLWKS